MLDIENFWKGRFVGANSTSTRELSGWLSNAAPIEGFVEPTLSVLEGDPESARLLIIAAPGAVGKSSYASALAAAANCVIVDLAKTSPLGGNFFTGGLAKACGMRAPSEAADGRIALVVDALDEAQMRAGQQGYEAGLLDLASIAMLPSALPTVLLGRALAAEDAYLLLTAHGHSACLLQVEFFSDAQATQYLRNKLPLLATRAQAMQSAYDRHAAVFHDLAQEARGKLIAVAGCDKTRFAGYAPVLDAICEFTLEADGLNPQAKIAKLKSTSQIELIEDITVSILEREQGKLQAQFRERHPEVTDEILRKLYSVSEQLERVSFNFFRDRPPAEPELPQEIYYTTYHEMVGRFAPQHPFIATDGVASNPVFAAYVVAWALRKSRQVGDFRKAIAAQPAFISGIFFELYVRRLQESSDRIVPLADVGILYQALNSQTTPGQRVQLEVVEEEGDPSVIEVSFEILERIEASTQQATAARMWGPYPTTAESILELHSPFSNVYVDAPSVTVELGDGIVQQIGAPTELSVENLLISAKQVLVQNSSPDGSRVRQAVALFALEAGFEGVQTVIVREDTELSVSWPGAQTFPWTPCFVAIPAAPDDVTFMRRRLRRILTAFRSHSKGALVRLAAKIDATRMTKDARGVALLNRLKDDRIIVSFDAGKFYELDPDRMAQKLGIFYHALAQCRFTPESDSYLADVLAHG